jgi:hypothetical protein
MFEKEMEREESKLPLYIISPHGKFRLRWDLLSVLLISCEYHIATIILCYKPLVGWRTNDFTAEIFVLIVDNGIIIPV